MATPPKPESKPDQPRYAALIEIEENGNRSRLIVDNVTFDPKHPERMVLGDKIVGGNLEIKMEGYNAGFGDGMIPVENEELAAHVTQAYLNIAKENGGIEEKGLRARSSHTPAISIEIAKLYKGDYIHSTGTGQYDIVHTVTGQISNGGESPLQLEEIKIKAEFDKASDCAKSIGHQKDPDFCAAAADDPLIKGIRDKSIKVPGR